MHVSLFPDAVVAPVDPVVAGDRMPFRKVRSMYNVGFDGAPPGTRAATLKRLFLVPKKRNTRVNLAGPPQGFSCAVEMRGGVVAVPRHYGAAHFGTASDDRSEPGTEATFGFTGGLRPYQEDAVATCLRVMRRTGGAMLCAGCGTGKTVMALALASRLGRRTAILVHKQFLATQWSERARQFVPAARVVVVQGDAPWDGSHEADIVICMIQTVNSRYAAPTDAFDRVGLLVVDECHHIAAETFGRSIRSFPAKWRLGLTATPDRRDGLGFALTWHLGPIAVRVKRATPDVRVVWLAGAPDAKAVLDARGGAPLYAATVSRLVDSPSRNARVLRCIQEGLSNGRQIIVISERRAHLEQLCEASGQLDGADPSLYLGETSKKRKLERDTRALVANPLFASYSMGEEALDIPRLDMLVFASPRGSSLCIEQCVGRILRPFPGKPAPVVVDFKDGVFASMARERVAFYRLERFHTTSILSPSQLFPRVFTPSV